MNKALFILISIVLLTHTSCAEQYNIAGNSSVACLDGHTLYLRVPSDRQSGPVNIDSCEVIHGRFTFGGSVDSIAVARVCMGNTSFMPVVIENAELTISVDNARQYASGGPLNDKLYAFLDKRNALEENIWQLEQSGIQMMREGKNPEDVRHKLSAKARQLGEKIEKLESKFVTDNFDNPLGAGYFIMLCDQQPLPVITPQMHTILESAPSSFFNHPYIRHYLMMAGMNPMSIRPDALKQSKKKTKRKKKS